MPLSKIQAESMNLADTYAFTGTVSGAGGLVKLLTSDVTSPQATVTFNSTVITDTYDKYIIAYQGFSPVTNQAYPRSRYSTDNGSSFETGTFNYGYQYSRLGGAGVSGSGGTKTDYAQSDFTYSSTIADHVSGIYYIDGLRDATLNLHIKHDFVHRSATGGTYFNEAQEAWQYSKTVAMNYIEFSFTSGNIADGTFTLFGVAK